MYLTATRLYIMHAVSLTSRYMQDPTEIHLREVKRIVKYVPGTINFGIMYKATDNFGLVGYTDGDWVGCIEDRKSTSGYIFILGSGIVSCLS